MISDLSFDGSCEVEVPVKGLVPGIYFMAITDDRETRMKRILVAPGN
jgi:hypothetical protein